MVPSFGLAQRVGRFVRGRAASALGSAGPAVDPLDEAFLRRLEALSLIARRPASAGIGGEHRSTARAPSTDFADYRAYMPGDDFRRIDWNAYGRLGHLYVKLMEAREQLAVHILLDVSASMAWGEPSKLVYGRQLAAAIAYLALARFDRVAVTTLGQQTQQFGLVRGRSRFHELLRFLRDAGPDGRLHFGEALANLRPDRRRRGQAIVISDLLAPEGYQDGLDRLLQAGLEVVAIQVLSPQELDPEPGGDLELVDAETGELVEVSLVGETVSEYRRRLEAWCEGVQAFCSQRGIRYSRASTATPFDQLLLAVLRRDLILR